MNTVKRWWAFRRWSRHGLVTAIGGLIYMTYGLSMLNWSEYRLEGLDIPLRFVSVGALSFGWIMGGLMVIGLSFWPKDKEDLGYGVLTGMSLGWSATYIAGAFYTGHDPSDWTTAGFWALIAILWWGVAGLVTADKIVVVLPHE